MPPILRRRRYQSVALWLALIAIGVRALLPAGYMPIRSGDASAHLSLALCTSGGLLKSVSFHNAEAAHAQHTVCPFAFAAQATLPPPPTATLGGINTDRHQLVLVSSELIPSWAAIRPPPRAPPAIS